MNETLTQAVMSYQRSGENWPALSDKISLYAYEFPSKWTSWDPDRCSDFFMSFLPRVPGLVERYKPDYPFETYLASSLRWYMKTFTESLASNEHYLAWSETQGRRRMELMDDREPEQIGDFLQQNAAASADCPFTIDAAGRLANVTLRRRVLFAVLLHAADIETAKVPALAKLVDLEESRLQDLLDEVRRRTADKLQRREEIRRRRNECWYFMESARKRMINDGRWDERARQKWSKKSQTWRRRYLLACDNLRHLKVSPSHQDIADLLELPVGTVASGLHFLRKRWNAVLDREATRRIESTHGNPSRHRQSPQERRTRTYSPSPSHAHPQRHRYTF